jgi:hypothetical protein
MATTRVSIHAVKTSTRPCGRRIRIRFNVAEALGCTHDTELPTDEAQLRARPVRCEEKIYAAYHTHLQGSMTAFDRAFELTGQYGQY